LIYSLIAHGVTMLHVTARIELLKAEEGGASLVCALGTAPTCASVTCTLIEH
jgi:hypothetical protein